MNTWLTDDDVRQRFTLLFEHNPAVVLALDTSRRIIEINPAGLRITGYKREQVIGRDITDFSPPEQHADTIAGFERAMAGEVVLTTCEAFAANGSLIEFRKVLTPVLRGENIDIVYVLLQDTTQFSDLEHDFRALFVGNPNGICALALDGTITDVNEAIEQIGKVPREQLIGQNFRIFLQGSDLERGWSFFQRALDGETVRYEIVSRRLDGSELPLDVTLFPKHSGREVSGVYAIVQDTTERRSSQRKNDMQAQRVRDLYLLATTPEYTDAHMMSTLQTGCRLLGMESGAIVTFSPAPAIEMRYDTLELFAGQDDALLGLAQTVAEHRRSVVSHSSDVVSQTYRRWIGTKLTVAGETHGVLLFFSLIRRGIDFEEIDRDTLALVATLVGSSLERRRTRAHLRTLAYYDALTGLPNRVFFQDCLRDSLLDARGHAKALAVLYFDLDNFKDINDSLGHAMGDRFLQMVARRLVDAVGENGMVARMGGDEFIVLLSDPRDASDAERVARDLLQLLRRPYILEGYEQHLSASAGISIYPEDARDDEALIRNADMAMYQAKERGGATHFLYTQALQQPLLQRVEQEKQLRRAIKHKQFLLHYQPIVDVRSERIVAVEALLRWEDDERGLVYPDDFIPTAEASGLIVEMGHWVISEAARRLGEWRRKGLGYLDLAINISARQFHQPDLCEFLLAELDRHGVPPSALEIEITESMTLSNVAHAMETVRKLKLIGARISVDDFGTGHSSLNYLRRFEIDEIKIDRSFVAGIGHQLSDETIVKAILAMGQSLGLTIVAEGVETAEQYAFLKAAGCARVQGYYFSRPLGAEAFEQLLQARGTLRRPG